MKILVIGGTGTVGSHVVNELKKSDADITVLTRSAEKAKNLPEGVKFKIGDLLNVDTVRSVFKGMDSVFLINTVSPTESHEGLMAVNGAQMAEVNRIVYLSVHHVYEAPHLPHFGAKIPIELAIKESGIPYTILRPNNFYQNDYWFKEALLQHSIYPQPIGDKGISRVDVHDIAEVAAKALLGDTPEDKTYNLGGPEKMTGRNTAQIWGKALNEQVTYAGNDLESWEQQQLNYMPDWLVFDYKLMYIFFQNNGFQATKSDINQLTEVLGHPPRSFEDFARETAEQWKKVIAK